METLSKNVCPHCGKKVFEHIETKYCMYCGKKININTCINQECIVCKQEVILPDGAKYCPICGGFTTYEEDIPF